MTQLPDQPDSATTGLQVVEESRLWAEIQAAGPLPDTSTFDPLLVDDVLQAERSIAQYDRRRAFVATYAWAVPTRQAIEQVATFVGDSRLLEVCAGKGLWALLLSRAGVQVVATDGARSEDAWFQIEVSEAELAVQGHADCRALFLSWPPFKDACAFRALRAFQGDRFVFAGDPRFTAEAQFHDLLQRSWRLADTIPLPSWPGIRDEVHLYERISQSDVNWPRLLTGWQGA